MSKVALSPVAQWDSPRHSHCTYKGISGPRTGKEKMVPPWLENYYLIILHL